MQTPRAEPSGDRAPIQVEVAVVGAGVAGLATAWELARAGVEGVAVFEAEAGSARHSSGLNAAILRTVIDEPALADLAERSGRFFDQPPTGFAPGPLVRRVGLVLTADTEAAAERLDAAVARSTRPIERLDPRGLRSRVPFLATDARTAWLAPTDGVLDITALTAGFEAASRAAGVAFHFGARVAALTTRGGEVRGLELADGREVRAGAVLLAAGGWAAELARPHGSPVRLEPRRRHLLVTAPDPRVDPRWPVVWNAGDAFYARPESGGLLLCACDETVVAPDACGVDPSVRERIAEVTARHLPDFADAAAAHLWCGMRTFTADHDFVIGPDPVLGGLYWAAGLGGHGMTTGPAVGALAADALLGRGDAGERAAFDPGRAGAHG